MGSRRVGTPRRLRACGNLVLVAVGVFEKDGIVLAVFPMNARSVERAGAGGSRALRRSVYAVATLASEGDARRSGSEIRVGNEADARPPAVGGFVTDESGLLEVVGASEPPVADGGSNGIEERAGGLDIGNVDVDVVKHARGFSLSRGF